MKIKKNNEKEKYDKSEKKVQGVLRQRVQRGNYVQISDIYILYLSRTKSVLA